jgi:hypothetical protein
MKESFERALHEVNEAVKKSLPEKAAIKEAGESLKQEGLSEVIPFASRVEVLELQKEKREIMDWLHEGLDKIDHNEGVESFTYDTKPYIVDENLGTMLPDGKKETVSLGDITTDGDWGIEYKLLPEVPRSVKKRYVVAEAKRHIAKLLDRQIGIVESQREIPRRAAVREKMHLERRKESYDAILHREEGELPGGVIAEKMLKTYFEKFEINNDAPFTFEMADISDDVERKIDFYLHKHAHTRGVGAEEPMERGKCRHSIYHRHQRRNAGEKTRADQTFKKRIRNEGHRRYRARSASPQPNEVSVSKMG